MGRTSAPGGSATSRRACCTCCAARCACPCVFAPAPLACAALTDARPVRCSILFYGQDGPNGNQEDVAVGHNNKKGVTKEEARRNFLYGVMNYRMWIFTVTYGFCFGVELVIDNVIGDYYYSQVRVLGNAERC